MTKRLFVLIGILLYVPSVFGATLILNTTDFSGENGETVVMPLFMKKAIKVGSMDIIIKYDPEVLNATNVKEGDLAKESLLEANTKKPGQVKIALVDTLGIDGSGLLANITFEVVGDEGSSSEFDIEALAYNADTLVDILITTETGIFSIPEGESVASIASGKIKYLIPLILVFVIVLILWKYN